MGRYRLYWTKTSGAFPAAAVLTLAGADWDGVEVDLEKGENLEPGYLALNPTAQVPTLVLPDGTVMTESAAIAWHLAERLPAAGLLPPREAESERATLLRWMVFGAAALYEAELRYYYPERYTSDPAGVAGVKQAGAAAFARHWDLIEPLLHPGPFVLRGRMSVLDLYLAMFAAWHPDKPGIYARRPALRRLIDAVAGDARVAPVWKAFAFEC
jgi:glutathione S-transferase